MSSLTADIRSFAMRVAMADMSEGAGWMLIGRRSDFASSLIRESFLSYPSVC